MARERELFVGLVSGDQSAAQRYVFFAERQVWKIPDVPKDTEVLPVERVGVIGAGTMGGGITMNFVNAGHSCHDCGDLPGGPRPRPGRGQGQLRPQRQSWAFHGTGGR